MKKKILVIAVLAVAATLFFGSGFYVGAASSNGAGSQNDPVVSLSYLEYRLSKLEQGAGGIDAAETKVTVEKGRKFKPGEGSVIVVYSGAASAVGGDLVDTSQSCMIREGMEIPLYSQILIPDDDSGLEASEKLIIYLIR